LRVAASAVPDATQERIPGRQAAIQSWVRRQGPLILQRICSQQPFDVIGKPLIQLDCPKFRHPLNRNDYPLHEP